MTVPAAVQAHWAAMPNNVRALYVTFKRTGFPRTEREDRIEAWGQLCFDEAAQRHAAYHMWNKQMRSGWQPISWRVEMDSPLVGGAKLSGTFPDDWSLAKYFPGRDPNV